MRKISFSSKAFTLIEIVVVIVIFGVVASLLVRPNLSSFRYWEQEGAIRKIAEIIPFLYYQAMTDGNNYRLEFELSEDPQYYQIGQLVGESFDFDSLSGTSQSGSLLNEEISYFLNPPSAYYENMIPPESIPSLAEPIELPSGVYIDDIRTMRGVYVDSSPEDRPYIIFSPRGFAEFAVIHLRLERDGDAFVTILVNPFTGLAEIYRDYRDFEWTYQQNLN